MEELDDTRTTRTTRTETGLAGILARYLPTPAVAPAPAAPAPSTPAPSTPPAITPPAVAPEAAAGNDQPSPADRVPIGMPADAVIVVMDADAYTDRAMKGEPYMWTWEGASTWFYVAEFPIPLRRKPAAMAG
jgi:hypothetical protein